MSQPSTSPSATATGRRRVAIVGAGWIAEIHLPVLRGIEDVEVVLVCDPDLARAEALARRHGVSRSVASIDDLSPPDVQVAHLLVPPDLHAPLARRLLERGIGVFVEKPLCLSSREARDLAALAGKRGLPLAVNHNNLFHPAFVRLLAKVAAGDIGRVEHVRATLSVPIAQLEAGEFGHWMFRAPGNIVFEQAVHPLSMVHALAGRVKDARTTILSTRELLPGQVFHDRWAVSARGERAGAQIHLAFGAGFELFAVEVVGSDGMLEADLLHDTLSGEEKTHWLDFWNGFLAGWRRGGQLRRDSRRVLAGWLKHTLRLGPREDAFYLGMRGSIEAFHRSLAHGSLRNGSPASGAPLSEDALAAAEVLEWCEALAQAAAEPAPQRTFPEPGPARAGEVIVLGASGFIGRRTIAKLLEQGLPVTAVVRRTQFLPSEIAEPAARGKLRLLRGSLEDPKALGRALAGAHTVLHLATGGGDTWEEVERSMVKGTVAAAEAALERGASRFVYVSSIAALDTGGASLIEDSLDTDPRPQARPPYSRGKIATERALLELHRTRGLPLVIARPGVVLGAGTPMQHSGLGLWARDNHCVGWGAGEHRLPLVWVDDVADALVRIARHPGRELDGRALNLCAQVSLSAREVVLELRKDTGRALHFHPRALVTSYAMEIGKWIVKRIDRRRDAEFPSWHDLKARSLAAPFTSRTARGVLGWKPVEDRETFLERAVRVHRPRG